jgi:ornithine cyclodeaminase
LIVLDAERTREALPFDRLIDALRRMFVAGCYVPLRHTHAVEIEPGRSGTVLIMPAWSASGYLGVKTVCIYPANAAAGLPGLHGTYVLYDARTGVPLAQLDGAELTARRTAATSALAAQYLARPDAGTLTIVGAGRVAALIAPAYRSVCAVDRVRVWNRTATRAHALVRQLRSEGFDAQVAGELETAVREADIVSCATLSKQPLVRGDWLRPGQHLDLIGAFTPAMREADEACFAAASVFIDSDEAIAKAGDLLCALRSRALSAGDIRAGLEDLCRGHHAGRAHAQEITVFKSVGTALEDLAAAVAAYETAAESAVG